MRHIDLFSGIGGFAYAAQEVWGEEYENVLFCDNDKFCQAVLRKHWPESRIYSDIRELIADSKQKGLERGKWNSKRKEWKDSEDFRVNGNSMGSSVGCNDRIGIGLLTGGFPCQPFSQAGKRRGKDDNRYLWPEMLEVIRLTKPTWVIAENVYGILSIEQGMVFEQVCLDLEEEGYTVRAFIIPACAVNAPHRRDRVWIVGYSPSNRWTRERQGVEAENGQQRSKNERELVGRPERPYRDAPDTRCGERSQGRIPLGMGRERFQREAWRLDWKQVATATCVRGVDDGLPEGMDGVSKAKHRTERLKMLGNSIVPQVAMEIMRAIKDSGEVECHEKYHNG